MIPFPEPPSLRDSDPITWFGRFLLYFIFLVVIGLFTGLVDLSEWFFPSKTNKASASHERTGTL